MERVQVNLESVVAPVVEAVAPVVAPVVEAVAPVVAPVVEAVAPVVEAVAPVAAPVVEAVAPVAAPVVEAVAPAAAPVVEAVAPVAAPVVEAVAPVAAPVAAAADMFGSDVSTTLEMPQEATEEYDSEEIKGEVIANVAMQFWNSFVHLFKIVTSSNESGDYMFIQEGKLDLQRSTGRIRANLSQIFGNNSWMLQDPKKMSNKFDMLSGTGDRVTVRNVGTENILYSLKGSEIQSIVRVTHVNAELDKNEMAPFDLSNPSHIIEISPEDVVLLSKGESGLGCNGFTLTLDKNTLELISIGLGSDFTKRYASPKGKEVVEYKTFELFPVKAPKSATILELHNLKTLNGKTNTYEDAVIVHTRTPVAGIVVYFDNELSLIETSGAYGIDADIV